MRLSFTILLLLLLPTFAVAQKKNHFKHEYRRHLKPQESNYQQQVTDLSLADGKSVLNFNIVENTSDFIPYVKISIKGNNIDTTLITDYNGTASITLDADQVSIKIFSMMYTPITIENYSINTNSLSIFKMTLGFSNMYRIANIYSKKKLSEEELEKLVDDLSQNKEDNELIINKTCYVLWEI